MDSSHSTTRVLRPVTLMAALIAASNRESLISFELAGPVRVCWQAFAIQNGPERKCRKEGRTRSLSKLQVPLGAFGVPYPYFTSELLTQWQYQNWRRSRPPVLTYSPLRVRSSPFFFAALYSCF